MHTHASCLTLAEGHFRLKEMPLAHAPDEWPDEWPNERPCEKPNRCALPDLRLRPSRGVPQRRPFVRSSLLALSLHMLCFVLLMAHAGYNWATPGLNPAGQGSGKGAGIMVGNVVLSRFSAPGPSASPGREPQTEIPPVAPIPSAVETAQIPPAPEPDASSQKAPGEEKKYMETAPEKAPAIPIQATSPKREKKQDASRRVVADAAAVRKKNAASGAAQGGGTTTRAPASGGSASGSAGAGSSPGETAGSGNLAAFGGSDGPSFKRFVQPEYPAQARRQGITGKVLLRIHITSEGAADQIEVVQSAHELLSKSAREAVKRSTFHPLRRDGKTTSCWTLLPISFSLDRG